VLTIGGVLLVVVVVALLWLRMGRVARCERERAADESPPPALTPVHTRTPVDRDVERRIAQAGAGRSRSREPRRREDPDDAP
jgi:hypothetical protein